MLSHFVGMSMEKGFPLNDISNGKFSLLNFNFNIYYKFNTKLLKYMYMFI